MLPTIEDVTSKLQGCKVFFTLDATSGYHQLALDENSAKLTTFMTPFGRFMFKRLPFGITSASEIFQINLSDIMPECLLFKFTQLKLCYKTIIIYS